MYLWKCSLGIIICILPIGLILRKITDSTINNNLSWGKNSKIIFKKVKEADTFLWLLLYLEGFIINIALLSLIISIPVYFIWHI